MFINDLPENIRSSVHLFADDCVLYRKIRSPKDCQILQNGMNSIDSILGKSCPLGWPCALIVFCLFVILVISPFGFKGLVWFLVAPVPVHCLLVTFLHILFFCDRLLLNH